MGFPRFSHRFPWFSYGFQARGADLAGQALAERFHEAVRDADATWAAPRCMVPSGNGCYIVISHEYFSYVYYIP